MFPISVSGRIELSALDPSHTPLVLAQVERALASANHSRIQRIGNRIEFRSHIWRSLVSWNLLGGFGSGNIEVVPSVPLSVEYSFSVTEMLGINSMLLVVAAFIMVVQRRLPGSITFLILGWFGLLVMNYLVAAARLRSFVRKATRVAPGSRQCPSCGEVYDPADFRADAKEIICGACRTPLPRGGA